MKKLRSLISDLALFMPFTKPALSHCKVHSGEPIYYTPSLSIGEPFIEGGKKWYPVVMYGMKLIVVEIFETKQECLDFIEKENKSRMANVD